jgi:hypothetical protein
LEILVFLESSFFCNEEISQNKDKSRIRIDTIMGKRPGERPTGPYFRSSAERNIKNDEKIKKNRESMNSEFIVQNV